MISKFGVSSTNQSLPYRQFGFCVAQFLGPWAGEEVGEYEWAEATHEHYKNDDGLA
jgi:hypothetical protein